MTAYNDLRINDCIDSEIPELYQTSVLAGKRSGSLCKIKVSRKIDGD
ncbi:hypothetical protein [Stenoxybacter acetivorans]|nr:hypothetical protein [Stenoxybacter acetivorans]